MALYTPSTFPASGVAALAARGIPSQPVEPLRPATLAAQQNQQQPQYPHDPRFDECWTKLAAFGMTGYARVVQLDADMLVLRNMDELMDLPLGTFTTSPSSPISSSSSQGVGGVSSGGDGGGGGGEEGKGEGEGEEGEAAPFFAAAHACTCNPLRRAHYPPSWTPSRCAYTSQHSDPNGAQQRGPPAPSSPSAPHPPLNEELNGGLVVLRPSAAAFAAIKQYLSDKPERTRALPFADQSLLSDLFRGRWRALPYVYNALKTMRGRGVHDAIWRDGEVRCVHYILTPKPWEEEDDEKDQREVKEEEEEQVEKAEEARNRKVDEGVAGLGEDDEHHYDGNGHERKRPRLGRKTGRERDETHRWWREVDLERRRWERENGLGGDEW